MIGQAEHRCPDYIGKQYAPLLNKVNSTIHYIKLAEEAGIEPAKAFSANIGFVDRGGHQTPSTSVMADILSQ